MLSEGTPLPENSLTAVTVAFPPRNSGLITFDYVANYLNLEVTAPSFSGDGTINLDNAAVANFDFDPRDSFVILDSGGAYSILGIRGVYVQPTLYFGDGYGNAGFYLGLLNGTVSANVLVFMGAAYDVLL